jgi:hypothetical protein
MRQSIFRANAEVGQTQSRSNTGPRLKFEFFDQCIAGVDIEFESGEVDSTWRVDRHTASCSAQRHPQASNNRDKSNGSNEKWHSALCKLKISATRRATRDLTPGFRPGCPDRNNIVRAAAMGTGKGSAHDMQSPLKPGYSTRQLSIFDSDFSIQRSNNSIRRSVPPTPGDLFSACLRAWP